MKKKIIITSIISVLLVIIGVISYCVIRNKIPNIQVSEDSILENDLSSVEIGNNEENTENLIVEEEKKLDEGNTELEEQIAETIQNEETAKELTTPVAETASKSDNANNNKETKQTQVTQPKQDLQVKETKVNNSNTIEKKEETNTNTNQNKNTNNTNNAPKCTHSNSNWYNSKAEAEEIYNVEIKKWGDKWTNYEIDNETYYKNCPSGYEVFSCPYCNKWTINLFH